MLAFPAFAEPGSTGAPAQPDASAVTTQGEASPGGTGATGDTAGSQTNGDTAASPDGDTAASPNGDTAASQTDGGAPKMQVPDSMQAPDSGSAAKSEPPQPAGPPKSSILVNIDKQTQQMTVFVDGIETYSWPVSTGKRGYSTPTGDFTATSMNKIWYSRQWDNAPMPHSIFFTKRGHAIHGTHETKRLGRPASKGCVRLAPNNAETLFNLVKDNGMENTKVVLNGPDPYGYAPQVAAPAPPKRGRVPRGYNPWFDRPEYVQPQQRPRLFNFGRRWRDNNTQGYYRPPRGQQYYQPRGLGPRGGY
jgi:lipoprotein-anchoring transpeptidase ErfK/SrfK